MSDSFPASVGMPLQVRCQVSGISKVRLANQVSPVCDLVGQPTEKGLAYCDLAK